MPDQSVPEYNTRPAPINAETTSTPNTLTPNKTEDI